jgi:hypothetical protein
MKVLLRRMLQAHNSRFFSHWLLGSVASWEGPEKLELSELILNPDLGFRFTVAYAISFQQRSSPPTLACVRCYELIPRRWDESLADRIVASKSVGLMKVLLRRMLQAHIAGCCVTGY